MKMNNEDLIEYLRNYPKSDSEEFNLALKKILDSYEKQHNRIHRILGQGDKQQIQLMQLNQNIDSLLNTFDKYVIASRTDLKGNITYASKAFVKISGYSKKELIGKSHRILRHPSMSEKIFHKLWNTITNQKTWLGEIKNIKKNGTYYWVKAYIMPYYDSEDKHIGYSAIRIDITSQKEVETLNLEVNNLLNNAGQGFLSFDQDMKIKKSFSKECLNIFKCDDIYKKNISEILFNNDLSKKSLFEEGCQRIVDSNDSMIQEIFLSLLPKTHNLNDIDISIEYRILDNNKFMLIITNITDKIILENQLEDQNKIQKMIVSAASNRNDFLDIIRSFKNFLKNPPHNKTVLLRELHTYKGLFSQKEMLNLPSCIHEFETLLHRLDIDNSNTKQLFKKSNLKKSLKIDINLISQVLGDEFFKGTKKISINQESITILESKIKHLKNTTNQKFISEILLDIEKFKYEYIINMLNIYPIAVKQMAQKLDKEIYPMQIIGDEKVRVPRFIKPFINSLIHLFNNCVEHGIEDMETRASKNKNEIGKINCSFSKKDDNLSIIISDDGAGINVDTISKIALEKKLISQKELKNMNDDEKIQIIFLDKFSTSKKVTIVSGRGVGMSSIKHELSKLNGQLNIINKIGNGISFEFILPLKKGKVC